MQKPNTISYRGDYINGEFVLPKNVDSEWTIESPADLSDKVIQVQSDNSHVEVACEAAQKAFRNWAHLPLEKRKEHILRLKEVFVAGAEKMAQLIARETGKPLWDAKTEAGALANKIDVTLEHSLKLVAEERIKNALPGMDGVTRHKPRGVMAVIGPFNFPAHLPNGHIIPALIAGNTVVFKPSDKTPAVGQLLTEFIHEAGFPPGVFNLVQGQAEVGKRLVQSDRVDGILFTGSYEVGLKIKQQTLEQYWKILALEMGGKNSTVVWEDADLEKAVYETIVGAYLSSGQRCSCTSKIILHKKIRDKFLTAFHETAKSLVIGHWSENPFMGPLISADSVDKYMRFQDIAKREGAEPLMRGKQLQLKHQGHYVTPSIYLTEKLNRDSVYQKTEIFGPNVAVYTVEDYDDAVEIVNHSGFGLVAAIFSKNEDLYKKAIIDMKVGLLNFNRTTNGASSRLPFGGLGKSGNDRPSAHYAIQYCTVPVASLEHLGSFDRSKIFPGVTYNFKG